MSPPSRSFPRSAVFHSYTRTLIRLLGFRHSCRASKIRARLKEVLSRGVRSVVDWATACPTARSSRMRSGDRWPPTVSPTTGEGIRFARNPRRVSNACTGFTSTSHTCHSVYGMQSHNVSKQNRCASVSSTCTSYRNTTFRTSLLNFPATTMRCIMIKFRAWTAR